MEAAAEYDPAAAPRAAAQLPAAAASPETAAAEDAYGAQFAREGGEVLEDGADVGESPALTSQVDEEEERAAKEEAREADAAEPEAAEAEAAQGEAAEEGAAEEGAAKVGAAGVDATAEVGDASAFDRGGGVADDVFAGAASPPAEDRSASSDAAAEGPQWLQQAEGTAAAEGDGQQLFDEEVGAEEAPGGAGELVSEEEEAGAAGGEDEGADDFDEGLEAAESSGGAAEERQQLFEEDGGAVGADSDAEREERRRQKRERREKRREKKRRKKEKKKKKKKQFAEDEAEESEGNEEAAGDAAAAATDDVERDLLGDAEGDEDGSPRGVAGSLLSTREAAATAELQQRRGGEAAAGGGRGGKKQRRAADDRHVAFYDRDEAARRGRSEDGDIGSERDEESRRRTVTAFDRALERIRLRKKRRLPLSNEECSLYCNKLLQQMSDAMQADVKAMEEGRPATAKLEMLDFACTELVKPKWRHWFLAEGCCQCIAAWLAPLKDNSLSNFTLRNKLLHVLAKLPITSQDLQSNDLGRVLVLLWDHPEEGDANRVLIRQLIQRWTRPMLGLGSSHREFLQERDRALEANDLELQQKLVAVANANLAASQNEDTDETKYRRARIPVNAGHNFLIQPKSYVTGNEQGTTRGGREGPSHFSSRLLGRMGGERTARRATRASKLFLEGRNL